MTTLIDRPNTALLVIDVQNGVVAATHERDAVVANVGTQLKFLDQAAHRRELIVNKRQTKSAQRALDQRKFQAEEEAEE